MLNQKELSAIFNVCKQENNAIKDREMSCA